MKILKKKHIIIIVILAVIIAGGIGIYRLHSAAESSNPNVKDMADSTADGISNAGTDNKAGVTAVPADNSQAGQEKPQLDYYEYLENYNASGGFFKDFTLSEEVIDGKAYCQLLNEDSDVKILVDDRQENAVIYHAGKTLEYDMEYLALPPSAQTFIDLLDVTGDGTDELIIRHELGSMGSLEGSCDVINLDTMAKYKVEDFKAALSSRITAVPVKLTSDGELICKLADTLGNNYYGAAPADSDNLQDYFYRPGDNSPYYDIGVDYNKKCLTVNTGIIMDQRNVSNLGNVRSSLLYNPETESFELSDDYTVQLNQEIYYDNNIALPSKVCRIYMKDQDCGWAVLEGGSLIGTSDGWKTSSELKKFTWNKEAVDASAIAYADKTLFICGFMPAEKSIEVFRSEDGGKTWSAGYVDYSDVASGPGQVFCSFSDSKHGYLLFCGDPGLGLMTKILYGTADGGKTFQKISNLSGAINGYPTGMTFTQEGKGFLASTYHGNDDSYLYTTEDKGLTWKAVSLPLPEQLSEAASLGYMDGYPPFFRGKEGIVIMQAVYGDSERPYIIYVTKDGGDSWKQEGSIDVPYFSSYCFTDQNTVYMIDSIGEALLLKKTSEGWK